jgi:hypothetical protein
MMRAPGPVRFCPPTNLAQPWRFRLQSTDVSTEITHQPFREKAPRGGLERPGWVAPVRSLELHPKS